MEFVILYELSGLMAVFFWPYSAYQASCPVGLCPWVYSSTLSTELETQTTCAPGAGHHLQSRSIPSAGREGWCTGRNLSFGF